MLKLKSKTKGFTLLEVMVALAIFASAAAVLVISDGSAIKQTIYLEEKILASWIAENQLARMQLEAQWPELGKKEGTVSFAQRNWKVTTEVSKTSQENFNKVELTVSRQEQTKSAEDNVLFTLTGYLRKQS
ncbi:type II secretion system minor pseudopilin GspI [Spartinivicinus poritis]|uniref:Type II secretion system protein I n=1 Tax=Spartinivicinus poritis TaxID=2994640 RepID=A0ABT5UG75_9GAMM|nr:type II secretion system minor pseudopilin GspI [Spartinivicinus sp. A2-2]MDE1465001.1 type II secretion system minor pseudopilin GspI [Spartinivicinus sp. A2-2]